MVREMRREGWLEEGGGEFIGGRRKDGGDKWMGAVVTEYVVEGLMKRRTSCHGVSDLLVEWVLFQASTDHCCSGRKIHLIFVHSENDSHTTGDGLYSSRSKFLKVPLKKRNTIVGMSSNRIWVKVTNRSIAIKIFMLVLKAKFILFRFQWQMIKSNNLDEFWKEKLNDLIEKCLKLVVTLGQANKMFACFTSPWTIGGLQQACRYSSPAFCKLDTAQAIQKTIPAIVEIASRPPTDATTGITNLTLRFDNLDRESGSFPVKPLFDKVSRAARLDTTGDMSPVRPLDDKFLSIPILPVMTDVEPSELFTLKLYQLCEVKYFGVIAVSMTMAAGWYSLRPSAFMTSPAKNVQRMINNFYLIDLELQQQVQELDQPEKILLLRSSSPLGISLRFAADKNSSQLSWLVRPSKTWSSIRMQPVGQREFPPQSSGFMLSSAISATTLFIVGLLTEFTDTQAIATSTALRTDTPKSESLAWKFSVNKMFVGFTFPWIIGGLQPSCRNASPVFRILEDYHKGAVLNFHWPCTRKLGQGEFLHTNTLQALLSFCAEH
uniref:Uncharacterized protein n=1 Tax=Cucumis melo TaxID=3656 RepID=A0A9I9E626_CUCME